MSTTSPDDINAMSPAMRRIFSVLAAVERIGNKLPHPFWLFWILSGVLAVASAVMAAANVSVTLPATDETQRVQNLLSLDGLTYALDSALENFAGFPPLPVVVTVLMGVAVAERSGLTEAVLRATIVRLPARWVTFAVAFAGTVAHVTFDAAFVILIPMAALAFKAAGRNPVIGVVTAYVSISAGYNASPLVTPSDAIIGSLTTSAAQIVDPNYVVTPTASYFWNAASSVLVAVVVTVMIEFVLNRRPEAESDELADGEPMDLTLSPRDRRAMWQALAIGAAMLAVAFAITLPPGSPLRGESGTLSESIILLNMAVVVSLLFATMGFVYGRKTGSIASLGDLPGLMAEGVRLIAPIVVLFFSISQFLAYFSWTGIGSVVAVDGAALLERLDAPTLVILAILVVVVSAVNLMVTSGSAMWSLIAPVVVPMLMYVDISPEVAQTVYRIGDSCTNAVTPMSAYFILALGYMQQYRRSAGIGTLASYTLPIALVLLVVWTLFFALWYAAGVPLGPGVPVR
ncbi:AbgT family transporter [Nocardioides luteus]|uniref:AbgT family transporter n=1 Tax=Nocardioides luteus TaxID=1844 RepID=UPI0018C9059C|nr:AbgT family transporter [Nocardioides luteus]MBG6095188.1 aminobenzoyl-glutamate transport protein [Nocardioides luteus]